MTTETPSSERDFSMRFTSTPRGARLARRLASYRLDAWGFPYDSAVNGTVTLIVGELAANAVTHGRVPGRDFSLRLTADLERVRVEVTDTRADRLPPEEAVCPSLDADSGRGLWLVAQLATHWASEPRPCGGPGKVIWADVDV